MRFSEYWAKTLDKNPKTGFRSLVFIMFVLKFMAVSLGAVESESDLIRQWAALERNRETIMGKSIENKKKHKQYLQYMKKEHGKNCKNKEDHSPVFKEVDSAVDSLSNYIYTATILHNNHLRLVKELLAESISLDEKKKRMHVIDMEDLSMEQEMDGILAKLEKLNPRLLEVILDDGMPKQLWSEEMFAKSPKSTLGFYAFAS